jgi:hypothetical protein
MTISMSERLKRFKVRIHNYSSIYLCILGYLLFLVVTLSPYSSELLKSTDLKVSVMMIQNFTVLSIFLLSIVTYIEKSNDIEALIIDHKNHVPFVEEIQNSEFEFKSLVSQAKDNIFIIGPNLTYLSNQKDWENIQKMLFHKLEDNPDFKIRILLMDRKNDTICNFMCLNAFTPKFTSELNNSIFIFNSWLDDAKRNRKINIQNLEIKVTNMITFSLSFIDIKKQDSFVLVTPIAPETEGKLRPSFLIKEKDHFTAFNKYYERYSYIFNQKSRPIKLAFNEMPQDLKDSIRNEYESADKKSI